MILFQDVTNSPGEACFARYGDTLNNVGEKGPARRSIRLKGYDYRLAGGYFVTICVKDGACLLGEVVRGLMELNEIGSIVDREWLNSGDKARELNLILIR